MNRDTRLLILLFVILLTIITVAGLGAEEAPPLVSTSSAPDGAKALKLWLPELGFRVNENLVSEFEPPPGVGTVFILQPIMFSTSEWEALDQWVKDGGRLFIVGDQGSFNFLAIQYGFSTTATLDGVPQISPLSPLYSSPALTAPVNVQASHVLTTDRKDFVTHLATSEGFVTVSFEQGRGRVVLCTCPYVFTNRGLKGDANAAFVLNLLALAKPRSTVWFDEWHHGYRAAAPGEEIVGPGQWLRKTPIGNALLFILGVVMVGLLLQGRAFGRPVPLPREIRRRTVLEHVTAVANLNRRAGHRADVLRQYHQQVKRHLGRRYRLDPALPDAEYVAALKRFNPSLDHEKLLHLLNGLRQSEVSEADMVKLAAEAAQWIKE